MDVHAAECGIQVISPTIDDHRIADSGDVVNDAAWSGLSSDGHSPTIYEAIEAVGGSGAVYGDAVHTDFMGSRADGETAIEPVVATNVKGTVHIGAWSSGPNNWGVQSNRRVGSVVVSPPICPRPRTTSSGPVGI